MEDEADIAEVVALHLRDHGFDVRHVADGAAAIAQVDARPWAVVVLDLRLPQVGGLDVCRHIRRTRAWTPILMLTAMSTELDRIVGLGLGADDYVTKPFSVLELVARVKALVRRATALADARREPEAAVHTGDIRIDVACRQVTVAGREVMLTAREFDLLCHFARHPGRVFSRGQLLDAVWGYGHDGYEHTVNTHVNRLRAKVEDDPSTPRRIVTVRGVGYRLAARQP